MEVGIDDTTEWFNQTNFLINCPVLCYAQCPEVLICSLKCYIVTILPDQFQLLSVSSTRLYFFNRFLYAEHEFGLEIFAARQDF